MAPSAAFHPGVGRTGLTESAPRLHFSIRAPRHGKAARHTVVLSHALGCDSSMWDALADTLAQECRVMVYDQRGHGASQATPGPYSMAELADDAAGLLRELDTGPVIWIGLSMGGMVGQELALRHPALVSALVLANTTAGYPEAAKAAWRERVDTVRANGIAAIADAVMARYFSAAFREAQPAIVARYRRRVVTTDVEGYAGCCAAVGNVDTAARLPQIAVPVLVIAGRLDEGTPVAMAEHLQQHIPHAQLAILEQAAHLGAVESPAQFGAEVRRFIASL